MSLPTPVAHLTIEIDGIATFYREAGPPDAPVVLLPHGYPCLTETVPLVRAFLSARA